MIIILDQTPLPYISPGKYTFNIKGAKNVPVKEINDEIQNISTFAVSEVGDFLPMQLIYTENTRRYLPNFDFPRDFNVTFMKSRWSNVEKAVENFEKVIFPFFEIVIVSHHLTTKFQLLDISFNKAAKSFSSVKYNTWMPNEVSNQLKRGIFPCDVKIGIQLAIIKPLHEKWLSSCIHKYRRNRNGFKSSRISETIQNAALVLENPFHV